MLVTPGSPKELVSAIPTTDTAAEREGTPKASAPAMPDGRSTTPKIIVGDPKASAPAIADGDRVTPRVGLPNASALAIPVGMRVVPADALETGESDIGPNDSILEHDHPVDEQRRLHVVVRGVAADRRGWN